jgi:hypothetical protein
VCDTKPEPLVLVLCHAGTRVAKARPKLRLLPHRAEPEVRQENLSRASRGREAGSAQSPYPRYPSR